MQSLSPTTRLLRQTATISPGTDRLEEIRAAALKIEDWEEVVGESETHGLAPLLHRHLASVDVTPKGAARLMLAGLVARHRQANATLTDTLLDVHQIFQKLDLPFVCLKGIALSHMIYPQASLRPMSDIDLLVPVERANEARAALVESGFHANEQHSGIADGRYMRHHHHLPEVSIDRNGMQVTIEIHTDAISGDSQGQLRFDTLEEEPQTFSIGDQQFWAMNHRDMLTHLSSHALQPTREVKLGSICDIVSYIDHFHNQIDFEELVKIQPWTSNALSLMHYVSALPDSVSHLHPTATAPQQAGYAMPPLSIVLRNNGLRSKAIKTAIHPPGWWVHAYYGVPASRSLNLLVWSRHYLTLLKWLIRRLLASLDRTSPGHSPS